MRRLAQVLSRPEVRAIAAKTGIDMAHVSAAAETLGGSDLERAAETARQMSDSLVGGASSIRALDDNDHHRAARVDSDHRLRQPKRRGRRRPLRHDGERDTRRRRNTAIQPSDASRAARGATCEPELGRRDRQSWATNNV